MRVLRLLLKVFLYAFVTVVLVLAIGVLWFVYYSRDLPDIDALAQFVPTTAVEVSDACLQGRSIAISYASIGKNLMNALNAAEIGENDPGMAKEILGIFTSPDISAGPKHAVPLSTRISRTMFCTPSRMAKRRLDELRTAAQLERRFSRRDLFTIYVNRVYFAEHEIGIQNASQRLFGKNPADLDVSQAALLAGLIRYPTRYSPFKHPDRAIQRRNEVIDAMLEGGSISATDAHDARSAPLGVVTGDSGKAEDRFQE